MIESDVQEAIQVEAMKQGTQLWRNNSGALKDVTGRPVRYGLGNTSAKVNKVMKSSDLIGVTQIVITPDMVGKTISIFTAIECKGNDRKVQKDERYQAQENFINLVRAKGGIAGFADSVDQFKIIIKEFINSLTR